MPTPYSPLGPVTLVSYVGPANSMVSFTAGFPLASVIVPETVTVAIRAPGAGATTATTLVTTIAARRTARTFDPFMTRPATVLGPFPHSELPMYLQS